MLQSPTTLVPSVTPEAMPGGTLLLVAYAFAWAVVLFYVFSLWRQSKKIGDELKEIEAKLGVRATKR